jgi:hypothetical protein
MLQVASISQLTVSRLSRQCEILNISQPYRPPRPVTGISLLFFTFFWPSLGPHQFHTFVGYLKIQVSRLHRVKFQDGTWNGKDLEASGCDLFSVQYRHLLEGPEETHVIPQDIRWFCRNWSLVTPEYMSRVPAPAPGTPVRCLALRKLARRDLVNISAAKKL